MPQAVAELVPRIRRALEGPIPLEGNDPRRLSDEQAEAAAADAIADLILYTRGQWDHTIAGTGSTPYASWEVDPALTIEEESLVARQAALTYFFGVMRDMKVSERIHKEGQEWEYSLSANLMRDVYANLKAERDLALEAVMALDPVFARFASVLAVRDRINAAVLEPFTNEAGYSGGNALLP